MSDLSNIAFVLGRYMCLTCFRRRDLLVSSATQQHVIAWVPGSRPLTGGVSSTPGPIIRVGPRPWRTRHLKILGVQQHWGEFICADQVHWSRMSTHIEGGLPHHRVRVYIVGISRQSMQRPFEWPGSLTCKPLSELLDDHVGSDAEFEQLAAYKKKHILNAMGKAFGKQLNLHRAPSPRPTHTEP